MTQFHPMFFKTPMVRAIMTGQKIKTRRVLSDRNCNTNYMLADLDFRDVIFNGRTFAGTEHITFLKVHHKHEDTRHRVHCKLYVDDVIFVRETYATIDDKYVYKADGFVQQYGAWERSTPGQVIERIEKWKPSLFMPKIAARNFLQITDIDAQRINQISEHDCVLEGIEQEPTGDYLFRNYLFKKKNAFSKYLWIEAKESFKSLWVSINGELSWNSNPYVWVISFKKIHMPTNFIFNYLKGNTK